ncbi:hypothetical protein BDA99DRAFT_610566 [Phascolomyces articulosus]|uniref:Uncharacterized protein n=1 Tax=Phascolomyces articulosus TaxID=60185 RepID=A0AAD5JKZ8_9FUNG|nr:hypothetical protein BDA99DRAFT_610566 [Phascolomyces articulosus]
MTELNIMDKAELVKSLVVKDALYMHMSNETFGIAAFPEVIADELQIKKVDYHKASTTVSNPSTQSDPLLAQKISSLLLFPAGSTNTKKGRLYDFIASRLSTKYAVTPVHTQDEFNYFNEIMEINSSPTKADWKNICKSWNNNKADGKNIFYKTPEHLMAHHNAWRTLQISKKSIEKNKDTIDTMRDQLQSPSRIIDNPAPAPLAVLPEAAEITASGENRFVLPPPMLAFEQPKEESVIASTTSTDHNLSSNLRSQPPAPPSIEPLTQFDIFQMLASAGIPPAALLSFVAASQSQQQQQHQQQQQQQQ